MMAWSIRWRLTLWNLVAVAAVLLGFAGLVYGLVRRELYEKADRDLTAGAQLLEHDRRLPDEGSPRLRYLIHELHEHQDLSCVAYSSGGEVLERTETLAEGSVPSVPAANSGRPFRDVNLPMLGSQRALVTKARVAGDEVTLLLLAPLENLEHQLGHLAAATTTAIPVGLLLAGGISYLMARRALAPVDRFRAETERVTAERLDRRLPVSNPHDELGRLAETINAMIGRLERSFAEVRRFTADASHELRTPLAVLRAEVEVAQGKGLTPEETSQLLESVFEECERLTRLTEQLLSLARQDAGGTAKAGEAVRVNELLGEVVETVRPLAEAREVDLQFRGPDHAARAVVNGEAAGLRQVFLNLLDNAIKYTPPGGSVVATTAAADGEVVVTVADTGEGIAAEHLPRVFDRFYRVDKARTRSAGGSGLGLSITRSIVEAHGGRVALASTPGRGTTATVALPRVNPAVSAGDGQPPV